MKRILMAIMAVAVAVTFSAPAFAGDPPTPEDKDKKDTKAPKYMVYGDDDKKKDEEKKKGGYVDTFGDEKKDEKKPVETGK
jgi:hypothetical protein